MASDERAGNDLPDEAWVLRCDECGHVRPASLVVAGHFCPKVRTFVYYDDVLKSVVSGDAATPESNTSGPNDA